MKPWLAVTLMGVGLLAGCTASPPTPLRDSSLDAVPNPAAALTNETLGTEPPVVLHGFLGPVETRNETVAFFVNSSAPASASLELDGTLWNSTIVTGNVTWTIPLPHGQHFLNFSLDAPGLRIRQSFVVTRLAETKLDVDYCYYHPSSPTQRKVDPYVFWVNVDARPSTPLYEAVGARHIDAFTAHDQLYLFEVTTKKKVEVQYYASLQGFAVNKIDNVGNPVSASAPPYWTLYVNGKTASVGMSLQELAPGDAVAWRLTCS